MSLAPPFGIPIDLIHNTNQQINANINKYIYIYIAVCQNLVPLVNIKIAGKWMFIPIKMVLIGIDPYPYIYCITLLGPGKRAAAIYIYTFKTNYISMYIVDMYVYVIYTNHALTNQGTK